MRVLVGGGSGFIGTALTQMLKAKGHKVTLVSRKPGPDRITWDELASSGLPPCDAAVNLAGENILNPLRRWNEAFQKEVISSRLETTHMMATAIAKAPQPPQAWVLVTGVAYYQPSLTAEYDEDSPGGDFDFFSNLVTKWEAAARLPGDSTRQVVVRSGENQRPGCQTGLECLLWAGRWGDVGIRELSLQKGPPLLANLQMGGWDIPKRATPLTCYTARSAWGRSEEGEVERKNGAAWRLRALSVLLACSRGCAGPRGRCHRSHAAALPPGPGGPHWLRPPVLPLDSHQGLSWNPGPCP
ncbi:epimerase family protein SDR39U1 isoform X1 [Phacochoerus africanus]|uniref:epimerase family protein SDR39U1 isoform X1 n=2 Tax=Phacochoerus africanus TaxID=41426 RepID=UPI001FD91A51|nr:epimerase family protein SDR39U1 isoform X1 [Phacochoerus africanus]